MPSLFSRASLRQFILNAIHALLRKYIPVRISNEVGDPKRILLINGAHVGDVVIATSLLPILKSAFPKAEIGFLTGTWSQLVVRDHPAVTYRHCADHWRMNRSPENFVQKSWRYWKTRSQALKEIRAVGYDLSISMHPWRADFLPLAWQAGIPARVAFSESLFAPLATALADYPDLQLFIHQSECQVRLLQAIGIAEKHLRLRRSSLAPSSRRAMAEVCHLLGFERLDEAPYTVIHMGSGISVKELPTAFWREIASRIAPNQPVLFTGKGEREWKNAAAAMVGLPNCVNACDHLSWDALVAAIRYAQTFYGVDSMAGHIAAATGTKCITMYASMSNLARFRPDTENGVVWANALPCSGCGKQFGCGPMTCMEGFDPAQIVQIEKPKQRAAGAA